MMVFFGNNEYRRFFLQYLGYETHTILYNLLVKKIIPLKELREIISSISEKKVVLVGGCFDLFHYGHLTFLEKAKRKGDFLIVALESDEFIKRHKGRTPIHNQKQRAEILASIKYVDLVIKLPLFKSDKNYYDLVKTIKPWLIAVSEADRQIENKRKQAKLVGSRVIIVSSLIKNLSSKDIIKNFL